MKLAWVLGFNVGMLVCGIVGLLYSHEWASNIFLFASWFMALATILIYLVPEAREEATKIAFILPAWLYVAFDLAFALLIVGTGHFALGALWCLSVIMGNEMVCVSKKRA